ILNSGATILKIEGRGKGPEYVFTVTKAYRQAIQEIQDGTYTQEKAEVWKEELNKVYNRGFWEGYYLGKKYGEWTKHPGSAATERKIYLGKGLKYFSKIKVGEFILESGSLEIGDTIMVTSPDFGMMKEEMSCIVANGIEVERAVKGDLITFPSERKIGAKDKLYKILKEKNG
ncbi:MAG: U32 family peptidase, partial [Chitinophagaceae bacterium]